MAGLFNPLEHLLSEQFWIHCEYMPRADIGSLNYANELLASLGTLALGNDRMHLFEFGN